MFETGAYGTRMAGYLRLPEPPLYTKLGSGHCELAVTHLHAAIGYSEPASSIPAEKAFSIHLHLRPTSEGRLWLGGRLLPTINRLAGGVTVLAGLYKLITENLASFGCGESWRRKRVCPNGAERDSG